ncbi:MAG: radical protein [Bacteroidota bacterium]|jgi:radical SAM protein with 4Fe4S-binding SPASM domain|nr:radical protein [Bacteroidota bacterium]
MSSRTADGLNFLSKLTFGRISNAIKVVAGFYYSKATKRAVQWGMPISVTIEPTTSCNLRCPECPSGKREFTRPTGMLQKDFFTNTIDELYKKVSYLIFYFQGEPYLNPKFLEMVSYASGKGIYTATSTNAHYLNDANAKKTVESGLDRLIISIDGTTQDTYEQYRIGGDLKKVIEGAENVIKWKKELGSKTPHVIFQFLVVKPNQHQIKEVRSLAKKTGVNEVRFKTAQIYEFENGSPLMPTIDKYSRYKKNASGKYEIKNEMVDHCWRLWHSTVITWDGKVVPCCFDKDANHQLGNLQTQSFAKLWKGKEYNNFRASVLRSRSEIDICKNCTEGTQVWS